MENAKQPRKGFYLLPNMLTTFSMFLGFLSMVWAGQGRFEDACMAILVAALMDGLDGKVARLTHTASEFGVQLDSLADLVAFGLSPAILLWHWQLCNFGRVGVAAAFIFAACGALRLARFNVSAGQISKRFFIGLPIPAGGCTVVCFVFLPLFSRRPTIRSRPCARLSWPLPWAFSWSAGCVISPSRNTTFPRPSLWLHDCLSFSPGLCRLPAEACGLSLLPALYSHGSSLHIHHSAAP